MIPGISDEHLDEISDDLETTEDVDMENTDVDNTIDLNTDENENQ